MEMRTIGVVCAALLGAALIVAGFAGGARADPPLGMWLTGSGKSLVTVYPCEDDNDKLCGKIVWLRKPTFEDGTPRLDIHNDDESLRDRPLIGIQVLWDMEDQGDGEWDDGEIYNPEDGDTYSAEMEEIDEKTMEVSGCFFIICKTQTWKRVK